MVRICNSTDTEGIGSCTTQRPSVAYVQSSKSTQLRLMMREGWHLPPQRWELRELLHEG
uniref:Uncharacterized protein n=1 Tax=Anguilla anguilla TaxID=7936 RepID=A0A0E9U2Z3_ANGAN